MDSRSPGQCEPGKSIDIGFSADKLHLALPAFQPRYVGHQSTRFEAYCYLAIEFTSWPYEYRFAIANLTYGGRFNATAGVALLSVSTDTVLRYENHKIIGDANPNVWNLSTSPLMQYENQKYPILGGEGPIDEDFSVTAQNPNLAWSPCMDGNEGIGPSRVLLDFTLNAVTIAPDFSGEGNLPRGITFDWGIIWEECKQDSAVKKAWGQTRTDDWSVCTFKAETNSTKRSLRHERIAWN